MDSWKSNLSRKTRLNLAFIHRNRAEHLADWKKMCDRIQIIGVDDTCSWLLKGRVCCEGQSVLYDSG